MSKMMNAILDAEDRGEIHFDENKGQYERTGLQDLANGVVAAQAEYNHIAKAWKEAHTEKVASEIALRSTMLKAGVSEFKLEDGRKVVWVEDTDEIVVIQA
jgi:hypothetical protein